MELLFLPIERADLTKAGIVCCAVPALAASASPLAGGEQVIVTKVRPGDVIINTTLEYNSEAAAGTGMVIHADGLVLTNNHVIDNSAQIVGTVISTGRTYRARNVGYDKTGDVAQIQLQDASGLTTVPIGNSSSVRPGEAVVAIGNAEGRGTRRSRSPGRSPGATPLRHHDRLPAVHRDLHRLRIEKQARRRRSPG
jgi:S1-C subfamily serine protease